MARVLIVDDERKLRRAFVLFLREDDHETDSAASLDEALAAIERNEAEDKPFDVVVTDTLPDRGGASLMKAVRERWPELELILASDERALEGAISAVRGGAHSYLPKPVTAGKLRKAVSSAASYKSARAAQRRELEDKELRRDELARQLESQGLESEELCLRLAEFGIDRAPTPRQPPSPEPEASPAEASPAEASPAEASPATLVPKRILVVDDERTLRRVFSMFLSDDGLEVETADDVDEGLAALERSYASGNPFSVIVSDICMPKRNGTDLMKEVAERWPELKVIVVTGEPTVETASLAVRTRAYEYMYKPVSSWLIRKVVANALETKANEDAKRRHAATIERELAVLEQQVDAQTRELQELRALIAAQQPQG